MFIFLFFSYSFSNLSSTPICSLSIFRLISTQLLHSCRSSSPSSLSSSTHLMCLISSSSSNCLCCFTHFRPIEHLLDERRFLPLYRVQFHIQTPLHNVFWRKRRCFFTSSFLSSQFSFKVYSLCFKVLSIAFFLPSTHQFDLFSVTTTVSTLLIFQFQIYHFSNSFSVTYQLKTSSWETVCESTRTAMTTTRDGGKIMVG